MSIGRGLWRGPAEDPAVLGLDRLAHLEKLLGAQGRPHPDRGVQEVGLIEDLADRLGLIERGHRIHGDRMRRQVLRSPG